MNYTDYIDKQEYRMPVMRMLIKCELAPNIQGFALLTDAVLIYTLKKPASLIAIYKIIADIRGKSVYSIKRSVNYAIESSPKLAQRISEELGLPYDGSTITVTQVLTSVSELLHRSEYTVPTAIRQPHDDGN